MSRQRSTEPLVVRGRPRDKADPVKKYPKAPFFKWDDRIVRVKRPSFRENVECGLHSGFPFCCIFWYVTLWCWFVVKWPWLRNHYHNWNRHDWACYVTCPLCKILKRKPARVRACARQEDGDHLLGPYLDEIGYRTWRPKFMKGE